ncbi:hypothetical protein AB0P17_29410 [Streptomyces sp. NPDC088124]|uniref:hypothetical protein n=1 Tax=Streptomyces sp. NPDC088124 TaxID=3154654 RepID=UPI00341C26DE
MAALEDMPKNAGALVREASELGWDVRAERRWTGCLWVRAVVLSGLVMVRAGVEETEHVCAWNESTGTFVTSASTGGFKAVRESVRAVHVVSREQEATGRTVWGRDAAEWVRQMDEAADKVSAALRDARDTFDALDGSTATGARAVELASAACMEAKTAQRSAANAVEAARAWLAETNGDDARGCASWRRAIVLAGQHVMEAGKAVADAVARAERDALAAPIIEEAQERLNAQEAQWRRRLAESGREPSARGYAGLIVMFEDSSRDWCGWFDGYTDHDGVKHAGHGDPSRSFVAQYDAWGKSKHSDRSVHFPSRYTSASLMAGDRVDATAVAFTLAVVDRIAGRGAEALRKAAAAVRKNPQGFGTGNDRKHLADWSRYPHVSFGEPTRLAEHAPAEWAALETAQAAYKGVRDFHNGLYWDAYYAGERANARAAADRSGLAGRDDARAERAESGRAAAEWAAAVERLTTARVRVREAVVLAAGDVERAQACGGRVREGDALAEDVWSAVRSCEEAYDHVNRAKQDAAYYAESAEIYRKAGALSDYVAECARMEDVAARAESGREETLNLYGCAFADAANAEEDRHAACAALPAGERPAAVAVEVTDFKPWGAGLRLVCACGAVHAPTAPVVDGDRAHVGALVNATDWMINGMLKAAGLRATVGRDQWSRGVLLSSADGAEACAGWRIPVEAAPVVSHCQGCGLTVADGSEWHATCKPVEPTPAAEVPRDRAAVCAVVVAADVSSLWAREAVDARTAAIELAPRGVRQPKGSSVRPGSRKGEWECGGRVYAIDRKPRDPVGVGQETPPNTVYDMTPVRDGSVGTPPIIGHAHGTADGRKLIRHYTREVAALLAEQETAAEETAEAARVAECERITSLSVRELAEEQRQRAAVMVAEVVGAPGASGDLAQCTAAELVVAEAAVSHYSGGDARQSEAAAGDDVAAEEAERGNEAVGTAVAILAGLAGSGVAESDAAPVADTPARLALPVGGQVAAPYDTVRTMAALGWCAAFVATVRLAAAGGLKADGSGFRAVDAGGRTGRRVKGERVRLLARCGYLAHHSSGLVVATEDGHEVLRLAEAAGPGVLRDEAGVMASVRKARRARQWDSHAGQDAHALPVLPGGGEERRRLAVARKGAERAAVEAEKTRKRTEALMRRAGIRDRREARREATREAERTAPRRCCRGVWPMEWRCGECRELAARGIADFPALPAGSTNTQQNGNATEGLGSMAGKWRITVKRITDGLWHATARGEVYTVVHEDREVWPWVIVAPNGDRIGSPSVIDGELCVEDIRDIVRRHADGEPVAAPVATSTPEPSATDDGNDAVPMAVGEAFARAAAFDLAETRWGVECTRHAPVTVWVDKFGDGAEYESAAMQFDNRADAELAARLHADDHARRDASVVTPQEIETAAALNFSRAQWRVLGWMREGKVRETREGFKAYDVSPDRDDVSARIKRGRVSALWSAGYVKVFAVAPGVRAFGLTEHGERAHRLWFRVMKAGTVTEPETDAAHDDVKGQPYRLLSARQYWPGETPVDEEAEKAEKAMAEEKAAHLGEESKRLPAEAVALISQAEKSGRWTSRTLVHPASAAVVQVHDVNEERGRVVRMLWKWTPEGWEFSTGGTLDGKGDRTELKAMSEARAWVLDAVMFVGDDVTPDEGDDQADGGETLRASLEFIPTAAPSTDAETIEIAAAGLLWQREGDRFAHAGRMVSTARVLPLIEAGTLYRSADGRVYPVRDN